MWILGSQSSVPGDPNDLFWLAQKWLTLFVFIAVIKMLLMDWDLTYKDLIKLSVSIEIYLWSRWYGHHSEEYIF